MRYKKIGAVLMLSFALTLQAQEASTTAGSEAMGNGGTVSYSVGQVVYQANTGTNATIIQGVQQPFEISVVNGINQDQEINLECTVYPNPTSDYLTLKINSNVQTWHTLSVQLYDINGKLISQQQITANKTSIIVSNLLSAIYFLKISEGDIEVKTFKIIKN